MSEGLSSKLRGLPGDGEIACPKKGLLAIARCKDLQADMRCTCPVAVAARCAIGPLATPAPPAPPPAPAAAPPTRAPASRLDLIRAAAERAKAKRPPAAPPVKLAAPIDAVRPPPVAPPAPPPVKPAPPVKVAAPVAARPLPVAPPSAPAAPPVAPPVPRPASPPPVPPPAPAPPAMPVAPPPVALRPPDPVAAPTPAPAAAPPPLVKPGVARPKSPLKKETTRMTKKNPASPKTHHNARKPGDFDAVLALMQAEPTRTFSRGELLPVYGGTLGGLGQALIKAVGRKELVRINRGQFRAAALPPAAAPAAPRVVAAPAPPSPKLVVRDKAPVEGAPRTRLRITQIEIEGDLSSDALRAALEELHRVLA